MDRVSISIPEELHQQAKEAGLNISKLTRDAIAVELERLAKITALDRYLAELEAELGPISKADQARAEAFVEHAYGPSEARRTA